MGAVFLGSIMDILFRKLQIIKEKVSKNMFNSMIFGQEYKRLKTDFARICTDYLQGGHNNPKIKLTYTSLLWINK